MPINSTPSISRITSTPQPQGWADRSVSFALGTSATPTALDRSNLRPLTQAFKGAQADYEVSFFHENYSQNTGLFINYFNYR